MNIKYWKLLAVTSFVVAITGCSPSATEQQSDRAGQAPNQTVTNDRFTNQEPNDPVVGAAIIKTDRSMLSRLIRLPDSVTSVAWQSGKQPSGNDWWLAAYLEFSPDDMPGYSPSTSTPETFTLPVEFSFEPPFDRLNQLTRLTDPTYITPSFVARTISTEPFEDSPLLNGIAVKFDDSAIFIFLFTM